MLVVLFLVVLASIFVRELLSFFLHLLIDLLNESLMVLLSIISLLASSLDDSVKQAVFAVTCIPAGTNQFSHLLCVLFGDLNKVEQLLSIILRNECHIFIVCILVIFFLANIERT